jgi:selenocysteine-specific elongation factor
MKRHFIVGTAGHIDHGKSSLVKALTGTDPDRLPEEKARGITIDLGFASLELDSFQVGIVDVPGHEDFVKNMVAGVGSVDLALFVVAADDGWMPQTEEHLQILLYLGVKRAVVALTKIDLATDSEADTEAAIREKLGGTPYADAPIIRTSVVSGQGLPELKVALSKQLAQLPEPADLGKPRLPIDRVFVLRGIGTVVTGTLIGGVLRRGQPVVIQPSGKTSRVRSVQSHNRDVEASTPATRTAVNLPDAAGEAHGIARGAVVTLAGLGTPSDTVAAVLQKSDRAGAGRPLKDGTLVRVHHGSANHGARVVLLEEAALNPGKAALAQLRFESPIYVFAGDRFIVRDWSEQATLAGGIVLDPDAPKREARSDAQLQFLRERAQSPDDVKAFVRSQLARDHAVPQNALLVKSRFSAADVQGALEGAVLAGGWAIDAAWWKQLRDKSGELIQNFHRAHAEKGGMPLNEFRGGIEPELPVAAFFDVLLGELVRSGFVQSGAGIRHGTHRPALPPALQAAGNRIRAALTAKPFEPPSRKELAPDPVAEKALRFLIETGEAVDLAEDSVMLAEAFARATQVIKQHLVQRKAASAGELRQLLGTNRRIIIPLLERLDRDGITRRQGDQRVLK